MAFFDEFTRKTILYILTQKSQVLGKFKELKAFVENKTGCLSQTLRPDNSNEYTSRVFNDYSRDDVIQSQSSTFYALQPNGVEGCKNRTFVESTQCVLQHVGLSNVFWTNMVNTTIYLLNRAPSLTVKDKTLEKVKCGKKSTVEHF